MASIMSMASIKETMDNMDSMDSMDKRLVVILKQNSRGTDI